MDLTSFGATNTGHVTSGTGSLGETSGELKPSIKVLVECRPSISPVVLMSIAVEMTLRPHQIQQRVEAQEIRH